MKISNQQLKVLLVGSNLVSERQFNDAIDNERRTGVPIQEHIVNSGMMSDRQLGQLLANFLKADYIDLSNVDILDETLRIIPEVVARNNGVIVFEETGDTIKIAMINPYDLEVQQYIHKLTGLKVKPYFITQTEFRRALSHYKTDLKEAFRLLIKKLNNNTLPRGEREQTVVQFVDQLLQYANINRASDVHIDPLEKTVIVRFRIDGILHDVLEFSKTLHDFIITRIKILSKIRTDEHRAAQDGKLTFLIDVGGYFGEDAKKRKVDVRVSIMPTAYGENVVMRILSSENKYFTLQDLGFSNEDMKKVNKAIKNPIGMILVTGPTGSGKTTSLYAVLKILNKREVNITTIEDPIEYSIEGITQIQVNPKTGLTFAKGLRGIVRQDPDIIMVGEIRDEETANIAVNSAMTGHTVLSTLHTNNAATTLPRLLDMGIEPFLVASTVNIAIAQRLVRKICESCRASYVLDKNDMKLIEAHPIIKEVCKAKGYESLENFRLYRGEGCTVCHKSGYSGRIGIFEVLEMSEAVKLKILQRSSSDEIAVVAKKDGMKTMIEDGIEKVFAGLTTIEEILRVAGE
jgi:type IV pilus assembly protein PilB